MGVVTASVSVSLDGCLAGPQQSREDPLGEGGERLHEWMFEHAEDHPVEVAAQTTASAYVMGRNMFGPPRGLPDEEWRGWWGEEPPYHAPVFVLTHHPREPLVMAGGTTFHFVTEGIHAALARARDAAGEGAVQVAGGAATLNQFLAAGLLDELRLQLVPITLGAGARLFAGVPPLALEVVAARHTPHVTHLTYRRPQRHDTQEAR